MTAFLISCPIDAPAKRACPCTGQVARLASSDGTPHRRCRIAAGAIPDLGVIVRKLHRGSIEQDPHYGPSLALVAVCHTAMWRKWVDA